MVENTFRASLLSKVFVSGNPAFYVGLMADNDKELSYSGYVRQKAEFSLEDDDTYGKAAANKTNIKFPEATTALSLSGYALYDAETGGNLLIKSQFYEDGRTVDVEATDVIAISAGDLRVNVE